MASVLPLHRPRLTLTQTRGTPLTVFAGLDEAGQAVGVLYADDGLTVDVQDSTRYVDGETCREART